MHIEIRTAADAEEHNQHRGEAVNDGYREVESADLASVWRRRGRGVRGRFRRDVLVLAVTG